MARTIFLTGAGGLLGRTVLQQAENTDLQVIALSSQSEGLMQQFGDRFVYVHTDDFLNNGYDFSKVDVLLHCAFPRNNDSVGLAKGLDFQRKVFEDAVKGGVGAVANVSSQSVYDTKRTEAATEDTQPCLETKYAVAKYMSEQLVDGLCESRGIPATHLRMASLIGLNFHVRIINRFVKSALEQNRIAVNAGKQSFGFLDVRDAAAALLKLVQSDAAQWQRIYHIGAAREWGILELAELAKYTVEQHTGKPLAAFAVTPSEDMVCSALDSTRFAAQFDWQPQISMEQFVQELTKALL